MTNPAAMERSRAERRTLVQSTVLCAFLGVLGLAFFALSEAEAILLDGLFNLSYFVVGIFTLKVSKLLQASDDEDFPYGYSAFEPLVNLVKGLLILGISGMALAGAVQALIEGGRVIQGGAAVIYALLATGCCWAMALAAHRSALRTGSPLLKADAANWVVNGTISSVVLAAFGTLLLIPGTRFEHLAPYVDPVVVIAAVAVSLSLPARIAWESLLELLYRAPSAGVVARIRAGLDRALADLPVESVFLRVVQLGRTRLILVHVLLPCDYQVGTVASLDEFRERAVGELQADNSSFYLDMAFTGDARWGEPAPPTIGGIRGSV